MVSLRESAGISTSYLIRHNYNRCTQLDRADDHGTDCSNTNGTDTAISAYYRIFTLLYLVRLSDYNKILYALHLNKSESNDSFFALEFTFSTIGSHSFLNAAYASKICFFVTSGLIRLS